MATLVACRWAGAVLEKITRASGQELYAQKSQKHRKSNWSPKGNMWSAIPVALLRMVAWFAWLDPFRNKAGYTAGQVACGWAGVVMK